MDIGILDNMSLFIAYIHIICIYTELQTLNMSLTDRAFIFYFSDMDIEI